METGTVSDEHVIVPNIRQKSKACFLFVSLVLVVASALMGCGAHPGEWVNFSEAPKGVYNEFTIPPSQIRSYVYVPVEFQGKTYPFLLDTGSSIVVFDEQFRKDLGKPIKWTIYSGVSGNWGIVDLFPPQDASVGNINLQEAGLVACMDLKEFRNLGHDIYGIIGMDLLNRYVVQIDYHKAKLRIMSSDDQEHPEWGTAIPLSNHKSSTPQIQVQFDGKIVLNMMIDTGASGVAALSKADLSRVLDGKRAKRELETQSLSMGGVTRAKMYQTHGTLRLGEYEYGDFIFLESSPSRLGGQFLSLHHVTFDFPNRKAYFIRHGTPPPVLPYRSGIGLTLNRKTSELIVHYVAANSSAGRAGVQKGDVILQIDQKDAKSLSVSEIRKFLRSEQPKNVQLKIQRGQRILDISITLAKAGPLAA